MDKSFTTGICGKFMTVNSSMFVIILSILRHVWTMYFPIGFAVWTQTLQKGAQNFQTLQSQTEKILAFGDAQI